MDTKARVPAPRQLGQIDPRLQRNLNDQLDGVVAFADFCAFLNPTSGGERPQMLIDLAQALYEDTLQVLDEGVHQA